jgi:predicted nuclease of predicted toxin-antitoxin system
VKIWVDAQLSPALARWLSQSFNVEASCLKDLGLRDGEDSQIFFAARDAGAIVMTKDRDFADLLQLHGAPPQVLWITCGNTSTANLQTILAAAWASALALLNTGEPLVEITGKAR